MTALCLEIPALPDPLSVPFPGGIELEGVSLEAILQPALAPLVPVFTVVDALVAVVQCVQAIPDALGPPPDPGKLAACVGELAKKLARLLQLLPVTSIPLMVVRLLDVILAALSELRRKLARQVGELEVAARVAARAQTLNDPQLAAIAVCLETNVAIEAANVGKSFASLGRLLGLLELFLGLIGGPAVPNLGDLAGRPLREVLAPLDALVDTLRALRRSLPG